MTIKTLTTAILLGAAAAAALPGRTAQATEKPNVVIFFIDDMGYGDIGPFGSTANETPNLDRMAAEGVKFTDFYLASVACSPSRSALMTGCYAKRVGMDGRVCFPKEAKALDPEEYTMAEMFRDAGYTTGCFGKWHLGHRPGYLPNDQGFDVYQGIPYSNDMWAQYDAEGNKWNIRGWHVPLPWLVDGKPVAVVKDGEDQSWLSQATTRAALDFIRKQGAANKPFFAYLPYAAVHGPRFGHKDFLPGDGRDGRSHLKAQIEELDWAVGEVFKALDELELEEKTLVLFLSDNGGSGGTDMGPLRGGKGQSAYEGGRRTAFLARWTGVIPAGKTTHEIGITIDLLPTFAKLCGGRLSGNEIDGRDISSLFLDPENARSPHQAVAMDGRAYREGKWKMVGGNQLYDLETDIGEEVNLAKKHPEKLQELVKKNAKWIDAVQRELRPHAEMPDPSPLVSEEQANAMPKLSEWLRAEKE